jgi:hypothetical protein
MEKLAPYSLALKTYTDRVSGVKTRYRKNGCDSENE